MKMETKQTAQEQEEQEQPEQQQSSKYAHHAGLFMKKLMAAVTETVRTMTTTQTSHEADAGWRKIIPWNTSMNNDDVMFWWLSAPKPIPPTWLISVYQASHLSEPLIAFLSLKIVGSPTLFLASLFRCAMYVARERVAGVEKDLCTLGALLVPTLFMRWFRNPLAGVVIRRKPFNLLAYLIGYVQFVSWCFAKPDTVSFYLLRRVLLWVRTTFHHYCYRVAKLSQRPSAFPEDASEITKKWIIDSFEKSSDVFDTENSSLPVVKSISLEPLSDEEQSEKMTTDTGSHIDSNYVPRHPSIGFRVNIQYRGGSSFDFRFPGSVIAVVTSRDLGARLRTRGMSSSLREAFFYQHVSPMLDVFETEQDSMGAEVGTFMLKVLKSYRIQYDDRRGISLLLLEDNELACTESWGGIQPGDDLVGATWAQACSVAVRYARFHSLHWRPSVDCFEAEMPKLSLFPLYDWMSIPSEIMNHLLAQSVAQLREEEFIDYELVPAQASETTSKIETDPWCKILSQAHQRLLKQLTEHFGLLLGLMMKGPATILHGACRMENLLWPVVTETEQAQQRARHAEADGYYEHANNLNNHWVSSEWRSTSRGNGVYDLAHFVVLSLYQSPEILSKAHDEALVKLYHEELLRHSEHASRAKYSYTSCFEDYRLAALLVAAVPLVRWNEQQLRDQTCFLRARAVRKSMFKRWAAAVDRLNLVQLMDKLVLMNIPCKRLLFECTDVYSTKGPIVTHPMCDTPLGFFGGSHSFYENFSDHLILSAVSPRGDVCVAFSLGVYPNRKVLDCAFCVSTKGVQHNVRVSKRIPNIKSWKEVPGVVEGDHDGCFQCDVGPLCLTVNEPLKSLTVNVSLPSEGISASLVFNASSHPLHQPFCEETFEDGWKVKHGGMTQLMVCDGEMTVNSNRIMVKEFTGLKERSWGVKPHPSADNSPILNRIQQSLLRNVRGRWTNKALQFLTQMPPFYWFRCSVMFKQCGIVYHVKQLARGNQSYNIVEILGDLDSIIAASKPIPSAVTASKGSASDEEDGFENVSAPTVEPATRTRREAAVDPGSVHKQQKWFPCSNKIFSARHEVEYRSQSRHARRSKVCFSVESKTAAKGSVEVELHFKPLFPFYLSGLGDSHPVWGQGQKQPGRMQLIYDTFPVELCDRRDPVHWPVQEVCDVCLVIDGKERKHAIGSMEQLVVGPHLPSGFDDFSST